MNTTIAYPKITLSLPGWVEAFLSESFNRLFTDQDRMGLVIELARLNVRYGTGGPFGAGIFNSDGRLIAPGVNLVMSASCSVAHAEIIAMMMAQRVVASYDLSRVGRCELFTSVEPCAMCFGALIWSGVHRLVCGARSDDARRIGFDEGPKPEDWIQSLERRGIEVVRDIGRPKAVQILQEYRDTGGIIYNAHRLFGHHTRSASAL